MRSADVTDGSRGASSFGLVNGWPGMAVELTVPADLDFADCDGGQFRSWGPEDYARYQQGRRAARRMCGLWIYPAVA